MLIHSGMLGKMEPRMNTNEHELMYKDEVFQIVGCAMEVLNIIGSGLLEKPYENAMVEEFRTNYFMNLIGVHSCPFVVH